MECPQNAMIDKLKGLKGLNGLQSADAELEKDEEADEGGAEEGPEQGIAVFVPV